MSKINLLPWREEVKEQRKKTFLVISIISALCGAGLLFLTWLYFDHELSDQQRANKLVSDTNTSLETQLKSLDGLKDKREAIIERMKLIQDLQGQRPITVRLLDELTHVLPSNVYLTKFNRTGDRFTLEGKAENPNAVADLMRAMGASPWYRNVFMNSFLALETKENTPAPATSVVPRVEEKYGSFVVTADLGDIARKAEDEMSKTTKKSSGGQP